MCKLSKKIWNFVKNNKVMSVTILVIILSVILFVVGCFIFKSEDSKDLLEMSANYITICSCVIVVIQLVAYVRDSRHNEARAKKESALTLAEKYAKEILPSIAFIENVLSASYGQKNYDLEEMLGRIKTKDFIKSELLNQNSKMEVLNYSLYFQNGVYNIDVKTIEKRIFGCQIFNNMYFNNITEETKNDEKEYKEILNVSFKSFVFDTMNILEYFAMSVNQNVAEKEMLYPSLHQTFLKFVKYVYPVICNSNIEEIEYYSNMVKLYNDWVEKEAEYEKAKEQTKEALDKKKQEMTKQLSNKKLTGTPLS